MDNTQFIEEIINKIDKIRSEEFIKNNYEYKEIIVKKKNLNEDLMEFKKFKDKIKKKALIDKFKPSNIGKKEYGGNIDNIDILNADVFNNNNIEDDIKLNIDELDKETKLNLINDFLQSKNIVLDEINLNKLHSIIDNQSISLKNYISISKMYRQISKIGFIKKLEDGLYVVDISEKKVKNKNVFFK